MPLANPPANFSLVNPPRVAFDFPNTVNALGKTVEDINEGDVKSVRIGESGGRTRLVLSLNKSLKYDATVDGQTVVITLKGATAGTAAAAAEPTHFADAKPAPQPHSVRNIDFKRGRNGEGQVVIDLSDVGTGIDLKQQGKTIIVELLQTDLPVALERRFDVTDFGTPVEFMEATAQGEQFAHRDPGARPLGAIGLSDRQPLDRRGQADLGAAAAGESQDPATPARSSRSTSRTWKCARCSR